MGINGITDSKDSVYWDPYNPGINTNSYPAFLSGRSAILELIKADVQFSGTTTPVEEIQLENGNIVWKNQITKPMKLKLEFSGVETSRFTRVKAS